MMVIVSFYNNKYIMYAHKRFLFLKYVHFVWEHYKDIDKILSLI